MLNLNKIASIVTRSNKRVGRGYGSGKGGHNSGRGTKGARSRTGQSIPLWFEGGQLPLTKRLPYLRGKFRNKSLHVDTVLVKLAYLEKNAMKFVSRKALLEKGLLKKETDPVKIVGNTQLSMSISIEGIPVSAGAKKLIEKAGGKVS